MMGSASAFTAPADSKSSKDSQLKAYAPPAPNRMRPTATPFRRTEGSERFWKMPANERRVGASTI